MGEEVLSIIQGVKIVIHTHGKPGGGKLPAARFYSKWIRAAIAVIH
jgi:hypothetical protein